MIELRIPIIEHGGCAHYSDEFRVFLMGRPFEGRVRIVRELEHLFGVPVPRAYREGFPHNNCGRKCVRAGITHFVHLWNVDQEGYLDWEHEEAATNVEFAERGIEGAGSFTVLKDRRGGKTKPMTFAQLRERILAGDPTLPKDDWGGCGCGTTN